MDSITWEHVAAWRARRHGLHTLRPVADAVAVARELCGLHAQLMSSAALTLHARVDGLSADAVGTLLWEDRALVKTWAMRGTLHLLPSDEYALWQQGFGTYRHYLKPVWLRNFHITLEEQDQLLDAVSEALGEPLTRTRLAEAVGRVSKNPALGERLHESWGAYLKPASFQGRLVFAPNEGQNVRFVRPDGWLPESTAPEKPLHEIATRYLKTHGPATREDFARWWGVTPAEGWRTLKDLDLAEIVLDGRKYLVREEDEADLRTAEPVRTVRLLPAFDQYVVAATRHAEHLLRGGTTDLVYRPQGWLSAVVVLDGMFAGTWRHKRKGKKLEVELEPFKPLPAKARKGVLDEVDRLAAHLGGVPDVSWL